MRTARGIYLDLAESTIWYRVGTYKFYFSSDYYRKKFINLVDNMVNTEKRKLEIRFHINVLDFDFLLFYVYSKIETRGFYIYDVVKKVYIENLPDLKLVPLFY